MSRILLCNDDGYQALGIRTLARVLQAAGHEVITVAPHEERSGQSHAMSFFTPVHVRRIDSATWAVKGTPADCAAIALLDLLKDNPPDLVISGINHGYNLGWDIHYSGTVGAATEASFLGRPAIAVSMNCMSTSEAENAKGFEIVAKLVARIADATTAMLPQFDNTWPDKCVLNINHPGTADAPLEIAHCRGDSIYLAGIQKFRIETADPKRENAIYILGGNSFRDQPSAPASRDDVSLAFEGKATMTLLSFRQAHHASEDILRELWRKISL